MQSRNSKIFISRPFLVVELCKGITNVSVRECGECLYRALISRCPSWNISVDSMYNFHQKSFMSSDLTKNRWRWKHDLLGGILKVFPWRKHHILPDTDDPISPVFIRISTQNIIFVPSYSKNRNEKKNRFPLFQHILAYNHKNINEYLFS